MSNVVLEKLNRDWLALAEQADAASFRGKLEEIIDKCTVNMEYFGEKFPSSGGVDGMYHKTENADSFLYSDWTSSFWSGMIWLAYEYTGEERFKEYGLMQLKSFRERYEKNIILDHHDIGFLYSLSCVAAYKMTGDEFAKETALLAAKKLAGRFRREVGVIQRGGSLTDYNDQHCGAFIVDCCLNVPLLFWAAQETGNREYYEMADTHLRNVLKYMVRENASVYQYVKLDVKGGGVLKAHTPQGADDPEGCWSRGQAWAVYGLALAYRYTGDPVYLEYDKYVTNYFLNRLQSDLTSNWDFLYRDDKDQRDTSATAITLCGLLELSRHLPVSDPLKKQYEAAAVAITQALIEKYMYRPEEASNGVLKGGVYAYRDNRCVNEPVIWGDYYFMEALIRLCEPCRVFW